MTRAEITKSAERELVGSVLLDSALVGAAVHLVAPEDFGDRRYAEAWGAILDVFSGGGDVDHLKIAGAIRGTGTVDFLADTMAAAATTTVSGVKCHAEMVSDGARARRMAELGRWVTQRAEEAGGGVSDVLTEAMDKLLDISGESSSRGPVSAQERLPEIMRVAEEKHRSGGDIPGVKTGLLALDKMLLGLRGGQLIVLAARTGMGKTALALNAADNVLKNEGTGVLFVSLEMSADELVQRVVASESWINLQRIISGSMDRQDWVEFTDACGRIHERAGRLLINDSGTQSPATVRADVQRARARGPIGLVVVDYLQLLSSGAGGRNDGRTVEVSRISRALKAMARDFNVPVLALSQLSRAIDSRPDHTPRLSDLRESGSIEQDADVVLFIHHNEDDSTVYVAKNRSGPVGAVNGLTFKKECVRFYCRAS